MMTSPTTAVFRVGEEDECSHHRQPPSATPGSSSAVVALQQQKKKRNLPGKPDPGAEVIALSPKSLLATNRFVCQVCSKGFQREQNLQLHRRGHNLPWKLKQKNPNEVRRRQVYLCPEPTCAHHHPSRALGDLTGVKKHYFRKHGEKKWKCDKCSKRYAVQSDWRAHSKICGTRDYSCDCGARFSRRDSFITHRAFCDALAQENAGLPAQGLNQNHGGQLLYANRTLNLGLPQLNPPPAGASQFDHLNMTTTSFRPPPYFLGGNSYNNNQQGLGDDELLQSKPLHGIFQLQDLHPSASHAGSSATAAVATSLFDLGFFSGEASSIHTMSNHILDANMCSFYNPPLQGELGQSMASQMPAPLLLRKEAGIGVTPPTGSFKSSSEMAGRESASSRSQLEQENQLQDLINALTNANDSGIVFSNDQVGGFGVTRDFLGVGSVMRRMTAAGGVHLGVENISSVDSETKAVRSFGGGRIQ